MNIKETIAVVRDLTIIVSALTIAIYYGLSMYLVLTDPNSIYLME